MPGVPMPAESPSHAVVCYRCNTTAWTGEDPPEDGQVILTEYADKSCRWPECPHKTAAIKSASIHRAATVKDIEAVNARLAALEAKVKP